MRSLRQLLSTVWGWGYALRLPLAVMAIGVTSFLAVSMIKNYSFLGDEEMGVQDKAYLIRADTEASKVAPPFLMLDLTQRDLYQLDYPTVVPRNLLANLLRLAAAGHPKMIVVDVDLSWAGKPEEEAELKRTLAKLSNAKMPPILLVRQLYGRGDGTSSDLLKRTGYDEVVAASPNISWVSAQAVLDGDGVTRRYLVAPCVSRGSETLRLPGVQLAACAIITGGKDAWRQTAKTVSTGTCRGGGTPASVACGGYAWPIDNPDATSEIAYRMRWKLPDGKARPQMTVAGRSDQIEEAEILDAVDLVKNAGMVDAGSQFGGRVVIIGTSAELLGDILNSSIGMMPGMFVMANAIRSGVEIGPAAKTGIGFSLLGTALMSLITYLVWIAVWRSRGVKHLLMKNAVGPVMNLFWLFVISVCLPVAHGLEFLYPQIIVTLILDVLFDVREIRLAKQDATKREADHALAKDV